MAIELYSCSISDSDIKLCEEKGNKYIRSVVPKVKTVVLIQTNSLDEHLHYYVEDSLNNKWAYEIGVYRTGLGRLPQYGSDTIFIAGLQRIQ